MNFKDKEIKFEAIFPDINIGIVSDEAGNIFNVRIDKIKDMPIAIKVAKELYNSEKAYEFIDFADYVNNLVGKVEKQLDEVEMIALVTNAWNLGLQY